MEQHRHHHIYEHERWLMARVRRTCRSSLTNYKPGPGGRGRASVTVRRTAGATFAGAVLVAMPLAGCGGGNPVNTGPFGNGGTSAIALCVPTEKPDSVFTAGSVAAFRNGGPAAVIDKVSLTHLRGLRLLAAWAVAITGHEGYGNWDGPPSPRDLSPGVQWSQRQRADGARIPPTHGLDAVDLVFVVKLLGQTGYFTGVDVHYHTSGGQYYLHISNALTLTTARTIPTCPP